jgi:hypothetical protein
MKKMSVLAMGFFLISAGLLFSKETKVLPAAFTLATHGGGAVGNASSATFFHLAGMPLGPAPIAGLGGSAYSESCDSMNAWFGCQAFYSNDTGNWNTALGALALNLNSFGNYNTASGCWALTSNSLGSYNTALGAQALNLNSTGDYNTASGYLALQYNTTGHYNTAVGYNAGGGAQSGSYNIFVGANSVVAESDVSNTIVIGTHYQAAENPPIGQNRTFIAGIVETTLAEGDYPAVVGITPSGRLGTVPRELLPSAGPQGPEGPAGDGFISGSLLFLVSGITPPTGYDLLGTTDLTLTVSGPKKPTKLTINVYKKQ